MTAALFPMPETQEAPRSARVIRILLGDVFAALAKLPDNSVDCVVTSPPYWGLRDYGVDGQLGLERSLGEHIDVMVRVFREVRRVLKPTGTLWLNYGDCYATAPNGRSAADTKAAGNDDRTFRDKPFSTVGPINPPSGKRITAGQHRDDVDVGGWGNRDDSVRWRGGGSLKPKDLCMIPNRLAIALQEDGWWVRSEIIWHKPNPMPESIKDRPGCSHEKVFLLSKSERYYYDHEAVRQPASAASYARLGQNISEQLGSDRAHAGGKTNGRMKAVRFGGNKGMGDHGSAARRASGKEWNPRAKDAEASARNPNSRPHSLGKFEAEKGRQYLDANLRNVWTIPTAAFSDAHFATFPPELVERCLKAGAPKQCCSKCGAAWQRETETHYENPGNRKTNGDRSLANRKQTAGFAVRLEKRVTTLGFTSSCDCEAEPTAPMVLDPFGGSGTTALVADGLGMDCTLIELNPAYVEIARKRLSDMFRTIDVESV